MAGAGKGHDPPPQGQGRGRDRPGLLLAGGPPRPAKRGLSRPARLGAALRYARHRSRPGGPRGQPGHREGVPRRARRVPLLLRQRGGRQDPHQAGLAPVLHRHHHLQKRPQSPGGHRRRAPGPHHGRNRRPLHGPHALPRQAV